MSTSTVRLTMAQALIRFLKNQYVERDGVEMPFFAGCFGIFGHGCVAGVGERCYQTRLPLLPGAQRAGRSSAATACAKVKNRLQTFACLSSIGPGATNMITGAATAYRINRLPVLLLPGDIFARRNVAPVLQQLESSQSQDISVNDCFKPVSRYWDRINRPDQLLLAPARGAARTDEPQRDRRHAGPAAGRADRGV